MWECNVSKCLTCRHILKSIVKELNEKQECIPVGYVPPARYRTGVSVQGGSLFQGFSVWGGESLCPGGHCQGGSLSGGVSVMETSWTETLPSPRGQTDNCENITWQTSFAGEKKAKFWFPLELDQTCVRPGSRPLECSHLANSTESISCYQRKMSGITTRINPLLSLY